MPQYENGTLAKTKLTGFAGSKKGRKDLKISLLFNMPSIILVSLFVLYPIINSVYLSFHSWNGIYSVKKEFVGLDNYFSALTSLNFWNSMKNCLFFLIGSFLILIPLSFGLALLITSKLKFTRFMKTAYFMPIMLGTTAVAMMWTFMLNPKWGILAQLLSVIGMSDHIIDWLSTPTVNVWCVVLVNEWMYAGYNMLIFASGIVAIPDSLYEAAEIDGCTGWKKVRYITIPLCKNAFKVFAILAITGCLKVFDIVWAMTKGGPNGVSSTPGIILYTQAFQYHLFGKSSAYSVILLVFGVVLSLVVNKVFKQDDMGL